MILGRNKSPTQSSIYMSDMEIEKIKEQYLNHYDEYADALYRFFVFQTSNRDIASDLLQETFMKTWEYITQGKPIQNLRAFVYRVARNTLTDYRRKKKAHSLDAITDTGVDFDAEVDILEEHMHKDDMVFVLESLEILDPETKELISLRYIEEMSIKEIAQILDERPNTVSVKIHRAVEKLKNHFYTLNKETYE